jgi:hypothetical protein
MFKKYHVENYASKIIHEFVAFEHILAEYSFIGDKILRLKHYIMKIFCVFAIPTNKIFIIKIALPCSQ